MTILERILTIYDPWGNNLIIENIRKLFDESINHNIDVRFRTPVIDNMFEFDIQLQLPIEYIEIKVNINDNP